MGRALLLVMLLGACTGAQVASGDGGSRCYIIREERGNNHIASRLSCSGTPPALTGGIESIEPVP